jgi:hypothetical protein
MTLDKEENAESGQENETERCREKSKKEEISIEDEKGDF